MNTTTAAGIGSLLEAGKAGIGQYLAGRLECGEIDRSQYAAASAAVCPTLERWMSDNDITRLDANYREGVRRAVEAGRWRDLVEAYRKEVSFGTGGIRAMMAFDRESIVCLQAEGIDAPILKGPNTINNLVLLRCSAGVARFGQERGFSRIVIGYDSRVRGADFAQVIAELFLAYGYTVYLFDEPTPFPEVTFAIPHAHLKADLGVFISASHNDFRYNGYKLCNGTGSQFSPAVRDKMLSEFIRPARFADVKLLPLAKAPSDKLVFLGGAERLPGYPYFGSRLVNLHREHVEHTKTLLVDPVSMAAWQTDPRTALEIGYCAFHGAGRKAVPRLLRELGLGAVTPITENHLNDLDGLFPCFRSDPGYEQQPDPGDPRAAAIAMAALEKQVGREAFERIDVVVGTDPDADRCGVVVPVPEPQRGIYGGQHCLLPADDMWTLLLWYRLRYEIQRFGAVQDAGKKFIVLSHTTSDALALLARKYGVGVIKSWVGFPALAAAAERVWNQEDLGILAGLVDGWSPASQDQIDHERQAAGKRQMLLSNGLVCECFDIDNGTRAINIGALEQSNGFSILGAKPVDDHSLGVNGHVRDKDGTLAALLAAEVAAYAKAKGTSLIELLDQHVYTDPAVGLFVTGYEPDPLEGEYPGLTGDKTKKDRLRRALGLVQLALAGDVEIAGLRVQSAVIYRTGKYDHVYPPTLDYPFPDEGVRFYLSEDRLNHVTVRPSGTGNSLRFHLQLHETPTAATLLDCKRRLFARSAEIIRDLRRLLKAD